MGVTLQAGGGLEQCDAEPRTPITEIAPTDVAEPLPQVVAAQVGVGFGAVQTKQGSPCSGQMAGSAQIKRSAPTIGPPG
ncbi:hypothetical protein ASG84_05060 [Rhodococcus sp. Leaf278]|nr:hypothetical protein ASG84_05060 [Rhodococcus sp. Leaf278]